jgi:hypothetical protein
MRWAGHAAQDWEIRNVNKILIRTAEGRNLFGRHRYNEDNIKTDRS